MNILEKILEEIEEKIKNTNNCSGTLGSHYQNHIRRERKMKEFNWDECKNTENKIAVHCKTEEEAEDFCKQMHERGMKWSDGKSYLECTEYEYYRDKTCYTVRGKFSYYDFFEKERYKILEWSDYMEKEFTREDLEDGMVVKYRNGRKRLVIKDYFIGEYGCCYKNGWKKDLTNSDSEDLDIISVYELKGIECFRNILSDGNLILIWERHESL